MALIALLVQPSLTSGFSISARQMVHNLRLGELNRRDAGLLQQGYYENLNANNFSSQVWDVYAAKPKDWQFLWDTDASELRSDFQRIHLIPSRRVLFNGQVLTTNSLGLRDREYTLAKPPGVIRIALMGPSYVMGDGVADEHVFDNLVEDRINSERPEGAPRVEILNFGISAISITQQIYLLENEIPAFDPDIVILVSEKQNDYEATEHIAALAREEIPIPYDFMRDIAERSGVQPWEPKQSAYRKMESLAEELVAKSYKVFGEAARARGYDTYWLYLPMPQRLEKREEVDQLFQWAEAGGMKTLDLVELWHGRDLSQLRVAPWDRHPNAAGHRVMAEGLYQLLAAPGGVLDTFAAEHANTAVSDEPRNTSGQVPATEGM
jgi:hypothetical protein